MGLSAPTNRQQGVRMGSEASHTPYRDPKGKLKSLPAAARSCGVFTTAGFIALATCPLFASQVLQSKVATEQVRASSLREPGPFPGSLLPASPSSPTAPLMAPSFHWSPGHLNSAFTRPLSLTFLPFFL